MRIDVPELLWGLLLGECRHRRHSLPMSARRGSAEVNAGAHATPYIVCLDCAKRFQYDWEQMRIIWTQQQSTPLSCGDAFRGATVPSGAPSGLGHSNSLCSFAFAVGRRALGKLKEILTAAARVVASVHWSQVTRIGYGDRRLRRMAVTEPARLCDWVPSEPVLLRKV